MFQEIKIRHIVDWAHVGTEEKEISHFAKSHNIPVSCLQHGIMTLNPIFEKYHPLMPVLPSNNSKMLVWGKTMESYLLEHNVNKDEIKIVGSPRHDIYFKHGLSVKNSKNVLITSNLFFHHNFNGINTDTFERYVAFLEKILKNLKSRNDKNIIIKLHTSEQFNIKPIIKKIDPNIPIYQHEDLLPLMESCDSMISLNYSTVLLDALILKKPTMVLLPERQNFEQEEIIKSEAVLAVSEPSDVESKLSNFLDNNDLRRSLVKNGEKFIDNYFSYQEKSSKYLANILLE
jgi:UDP-N-acetylglucosamine 2-epimerase